MEVLPAPHQVTIKVRFENPIDLSKLLGSLSINKVPSTTKPIKPKHHFKSSETCGKGNSALSSLVDIKIFRPVLGSEFLELFFLGWNPNSVRIWEDSAIFLNCLNLTNATELISELSKLVPIVVSKYEELMVTYQHSKTVPDETLLEHFQSLPDFSVKIKSSSSGTIRYAKSKFLIGTRYIFQTSPNQENALNDFSMFQFQLLKLLLLHDFLAFQLAQITK